MIDTSFATTKSGAYFLELTAGTHTVVASANGFIPVSKNIGISVLSSTTENFGLTPLEYTETSVPITIQASANQVNLGESVIITGIVTLTPDTEDTRNRFIEEKLKLVRINPDGKYEDIIETSPYLYKEQIRYSFSCFSPDSPGIWKLKVAFELYDDSEGVVSDGIEINVLNEVDDVAGYAILIEGRENDTDDITSYNHTTSYIYEKLIERGFKEEHIYYFNYDITQVGVDEKPSKDGILNAIKTWAYNKMVDSPAPLYIIYVGPGKKGKLFANPDIIKASKLSNSIKYLEDKLLKQKPVIIGPIIIVLGANRSGSFIDSLSLSDKKRVIIASCDTKEVAYKGPLPPDETIRHGDYFVSEFFKYAASFESIKKSYEVAAEKIALFTRNENGNGLDEASAGNGQYFDKSAQHPLLEDNGDGTGTYGELSTLSDRDGELSSRLILGIGTSTPVFELTSVSNLITLEAEDKGTTLFATAENADKVWVEIASPNHSLKNGKNVTEQQVINLPRFSSNEYDITNKKYIWTDFSGNNEFNEFRDAGEYEVFYFAREKETGEITPLMASTVFRNAAGNEKPTYPNPIFPTNGTETTASPILDWEDSVDPDANIEVNRNTMSISEKNDVTYTLMISDNDKFDTIYYQQQGLKDSIAAVDKTAGLQDGTTYYWEVLANDASGGTKLSETSGSFKPKLASGFPGITKGYVFDTDTNAKLSGATITVKGTTASFATTERGAYFLQLSSGTYAISAEAPGYETATKTIRVDALSTTTENIGLAVTTKTSTISGQVTNKKTGESLEGTTIKVKKKGIQETTITGSDRNYSITGLESGKYTLTAKLEGYKSYKKKIKLEANSEKTLNIKLSNKK